MDGKWNAILSKLLKDNILGIYNRLDVVTIFGFDKKREETFNVLTLLVADEAKDIEKFKILNKGRIKIEGLEDFSFGIASYQLALDEKIEDLIKGLDAEKIWKGEKKDLLFSESLEYHSHLFVPAEFSKNVPLNNILKNNFWNGSHIFEWFDVKKERLSCFFDEPTLLQKLSEKIQEIIPIKIASLSDRLGNFIVQIPVTICKISIQRDSIEIRWRKDLLDTPRQLNLLVSKERDEIVEDYYSSKECIKEEYSSIAIPNGSNNRNFSLWDEDNKVLLFVGRSVGFIEKTNLQMEMVNHEPRVFTIPSSNVAQRISIFSRDGRKEEDKIDWIYRRLYEHEKIDLKKTKKLIQYKSNMNQLALGDLRNLISEYGEKGVYLWDPYLSSNDVLETLFFCPFFNSKLKIITRIKVHKEQMDYKKKNSITALYSFFHRSLKAITRVKASKEQKKYKKKDSIIERYHDELEANKGNLYGLNLEFRASYGKYGVDFHDRFLIFPDTNEGVKAWSLGTSVNSFGSSHHIFQEVSDARVILDAFNELWDQLDHEECLIWRS